MPVATIPYPTAQNALNVAIFEANDGTGPNGMAGNILNPDTNPEVLPCFQENWIYLQQRLIAAGVDDFRTEAIVYGLGPSMSPNPTQQMFLTFEGYYNGLVWTGPNVSAPSWDDSTTYTQGMTVTYGAGAAFYVAVPNSTANLNMEPDSSPAFWQPFNNIGPTLPPNLAKPLEMWEQQSNASPYWQPMRQVPDSVSTFNLQQRYGVWMYEDGKLTLPGTTTTSNLKIKYLGMKPPIVDFNSVLYVQGCQKVLAFFVLAAMAGGRGGPMADTYEGKAEKALNAILNQTSMKQAYSSFQRKPFRGRGRGTSYRNGI